MKRIVLFFILLFIMFSFNILSSQSTDSDIENNIKYFFSIPYWDDDVYQVEKSEALNRGTFYAVSYYSKNKPAVLSYYNNQLLEYRYFYDPNRIILKRESYEEGVADGYWFEYINIRYFPYPKRRIFYDKGVPLSTTLFTYYSNGQIMSEENFQGLSNFQPDSEIVQENSIRDGYTRIYDRKGFIIYETFFTNGLKDGEERISDFHNIDIDDLLTNQGIDIEKLDQIEKYKKFVSLYSYYKAGKMKEIHHFNEGIRELQSTIFDYINNKKINIFYDDNGNESRRDITVKDNMGRTVRITKFVNGTMPYGLWEYYDNNANLIKTERYMDGFKHGEWQYYEYINDVRKTVRLEHYENDQLIYFKIFNYDGNTGKRLDENRFNGNGQPDREWYYYDDNDNLIHKQEYKDGIPDGIWLWWDVLEDGRIETQRYVIYEDGEIIQSYEYEYDEND